MSWLRKKLYDTARIKKRTEVDECGGIHQIMYYIEYTTIYFGFIAVSTIFSEVVCYHDDCVDYPVTRSSKEELLKLWDEMLIINRERHDIVEDVGAVNKKECD